MPWITHHRLIPLAMLAVLAYAGMANSAPQAQTEPERTQPEQKQPAPPQAAPPSSDQPPPPPQAPGRRRQGNQLRIPNEIEVVRDVVYATVKTAAGEEVELRFDAAFLKQSDGKPMPAIVYIHGGGWRGGSRQSGMQQSVALALGGYFAMTIDYRLAGQAKFPAAVEDCKAAISFIREHSDELGIDPNRIGVWGHSAGGHLAAMVGATGNSDGLSNGGLAASSAVQCVVDISGPIDLTRDIDGGMIEYFLGGPASELGKKASPTSYLDANDPPVLIVHGTEDQLVNIRHAVSFEAALKEAGVKVEYLPVQGAGHGIVQPRAYVRVAEFFDAHLGGKAAERVRLLQRGTDAQPARPRRPQASEQDEN